MLNFLLSNHAIQRSAQRNLSDEDIGFILQHGSRVHRAGVIFCQLRVKDLPDATPGNHRYRQLTGTTVVLSKCGHYVITVYRNRKAFQKDTRKTRYTYAPLEYTTCPYAHAAQPVKSSHTMAMGCAW